MKERQGPALCPEAAAELSTPDPTASVGTATRVTHTELDCSSPGAAGTETRLHLEEPMQMAPLHLRLRTRTRAQRTPRSSSGHPSRCVCCLRSPSSSWPT